MSATTLYTKLLQANEQKRYGFRREAAKACGISERQLARWLAQTHPFKPSYQTAQALEKHLAKCSRRKKA